MAFDRKNLQAGNGGKRKSVPLYWTFYNEDGDTVTAAGYMTNCFEMTVGDQVTSLSADYTTRVDYRISAVTLGAATLIANA